MEVCSSLNLSLTPSPLLLLYTTNICRTHWMEVCSPLNLSLSPLLLLYTTNICRTHWMEVCSPLNLSLSPLLLLYTTNICRTHWMEVCSPLNLSLTPPPYYCYIQQTSVGDSLDGSLFSSQSESLPLNTVIYNKHL